MKNKIPYNTVEAVDFLNLKFAQIHKIKKMPKISGHCHMEALVNSESNLLKAFFKYIKSFVPNLSL